MPHLAERLAECLAELTGLRDRDLLDARFVGVLMELLNPDEVAVYRVLGEVGDTRARGSASASASARGSGSGSGEGGWLTCARLRRGESAVHADPLPDDWRVLPPLDSAAERLACLRQQAVMAAPGPPARAWFPVNHETHALHTLSVLEIASAEPLDADALRLLDSIFRVYRNLQGLLDYSERDTLTGLLNRKTFENSFMGVAAPQPPLRAASPTAELRRLTPTGSLWLAVIDIDHFKQVNDVFGHLIGDEVLLLLSRLMRSCFRFHDRLYRFGGEEFVVLMRCDGLDATASALERLRARVAAHRFPQVVHITVSLGFTELRADDTPSAAFDRADQALYFVKQHGRNGVANHARLVASGYLKDRDRTGQVELF